METIFKSPFSGYRYLEADFNWPRGVVVDSEGDIIFSDGNNNRIMKIIKKSKIVVVAGSGEVGDSDGRGLSAKFNMPFGLDIDSKDNVYVCDGNNNAIRKINRDGLVTTIYNGPDNNPCYDVAYFEKTDTVFFCDGLKIHRIQGDGTGYKVWAGSLMQPSKASIYFNCYPLYLVYEIIYKTPDYRMVKEQMHFSTLSMASLSISLQGICME